MVDSSSERLSKMISLDERVGRSAVISRWKLLLDLTFLYFFGEGDLIFIREKREF